MPRTAFYLHISLLLNRSNKSLSPQLATTTIMPPKKKKKEESWRSCEGRKLLADDIRFGRIPDAMAYEHAFLLHPEFNVGESQEEALRLFEGRLSRARQRNKDKNTRAETELALMQQDVAARPPAATDHWGVPRWSDSAAQKMLKQDVAAKKHETMTNAEFHQSRPEYQAYSERYIARKIQQELARGKFLTQYRERRGGF